MFYPLRQIAVPFRRFVVSANVYEGSAGIYGRNLDPNMYGNGQRISNTSVYTFSSLEKNKDLSAETTNPKANTRTYATLFYWH